MTLYLVAKDRNRQNLKNCYFITMNGVTELMDHMMELPRDDRSYIAKKLIESLDESPGLEAEWMKEIEERVARKQSGETSAVSNELVHQDIEKILTR
jgi:putative addiction module component (TIGR02574 family)